MVALIEDCGIGSNSSALGASNSSTSKEQSRKRSWLHFHISRQVLANNKQSHLPSFARASIRAICCFGPAEPMAVQRAAALGGHVRIGFENNRLLPDGTHARNNAQLVASELALLRGTAAARRPIATADWVRRQLAG